MPQTIYWFYADNKPVGMIKIRHYLNNYLLAHGGHIGYGIIASTRGKGYASEMLKLALVEAKKLGIEDALITCDSNNIGSQRVAEKNGGILEQKTEKDGCFYWIHIEEE